MIQAIQREPDRTGEWQGLEFAQPRGRTILALLGTVAMSAVAGWLLWLGLAADGGPKAVIAGGLGVLFFGAFGIPMTIVQLLKRQFLRLTPDAIEFHYNWFSGHLAWNHVESVGLEIVSGVRMVGLRCNPPHPGANAAATRALCGFDAGVSKMQVTVPLPLLATLLHFYRENAGSRIELSDPHLARARLENLQAVVEY